MDQDTITVNPETPLDRAPDPRLRPSVASLLHRAVRAERRRVSAWLLAGAVTVAGALALASAAGALLAGLMGLALAVWSARQVVTLGIARRDFHSADTPPRRAYVVLLHDPNPQAFRPLLAVWAQPPPPCERLPKPQNVWRCDDELDELKSSQGSVVVHEAWLDTGPRSRSKPRWVCADAGIAVPHRRALLGRWYVSMVVRSDRPGEARRLTLGDPHGVPQTAEELPLDGSLLRSVAGRIVFLAGSSPSCLRWHKPALRSSGGPDASRLERTPRRLPRGARADTRRGGSRTELSGRPVPVPPLRGSRPSTRSNGGGPTRRAAASLPCAKLGAWRPRPPEPTR